MNLAPERPGQPRMMTVDDGIEAGHWYSPEAVREMVEAERELCAKQLIAMGCSQSAFAIRLLGGNS